jgi:hypothetical protein
VIELRKVDFLERVMSVAAGGLTAEAVAGEIQHPATLFSGDRRQAMQGHDIIQLICWLAHRKGVDRKIADPALVQRAMLASLEIEDLSAEPLFGKIAAWARGG